MTLVAITGVPYDLRCYSTLSTPPFTNWMVPHTTFVPSSFSTTSGWYPTKEKDKAEPLGVVQSSSMIFETLAAHSCLLPVRCMSWCVELTIHFSIGTSVKGLTCVLFSRDEKCRIGNLDVSKVETANEELSTIVRKKRDGGSATVTPSHKFAPTRDFREPTNISLFLRLQCKKQNGVWGVHTNILNPFFLPHLTLPT